MPRQSHAKSRSFQLPLLFLRGEAPSMCAYPVHAVRVAGKRPTMDQHQWRPISDAAVCNLRRPDLQVGWLCSSKPRRTRRERISILHGWSPMRLLRVHQLPLLGSVAVVAGHTKSDKSTYAQSLQHKSHSFIPQPLEHGISNSKAKTRGNIFALP